MKNVPDRTGRFSQRPHYMPAELDRECDATIINFLTALHGKAEFPVGTDDITKLVERDSEDLDLFADLSSYGPTVEGLTEFRPGKKPSVKIASELAEDAKRENRLRTTLTHEWGHVHFHSYLWELEPPGADLISNNPNASRQICKRETILDARQADWMEWQAGYVCGAILMPASRVRRVISTYNEAEGIYGCVSPKSRHATELTAQIKIAFGVSEQAARVRLFKLKAIGTETGPSLFSLPPAA